MLSQILSVFAPTPRVAVAPDANISLAATDVLLALLFIGAIFLMRKRILRIFCACAAEICLFLAVKIIFGEDSVITFIMCWITAAVACIVTIAIVNRIDWGNLRRGKKRS